MTNEATTPIFTDATFPAASVACIDRMTAADLAAPEGERVFHDIELAVLSIISSVRDSIDLGAALVPFGAVRYVAATGGAIAAFETEDAAVAWLEETPPRGFTPPALVRIDRSSLTDRATHIVY
jgi:hypothetical protein